MKKHNYPLYPSFTACATMEELVSDMAARLGDKPALSYRRHPKDPAPQTVTFRAFSEDVRALSREFVRRGMTGVHCAIIGKLSYEWLCAYLALQIAGNVAVPLDREWSADDLVSTLSSADCSYVLLDDDIAVKVGNVLPACTCYSLEQPEGGIRQMIVEGKKHPDVICPAHDPAGMSVLVFTSGTTGKGKGVMLSERGILSNIYNTFRILKPTSRSIATLPPHHTYGSNIAVIALLYGGMHLYISSGIKYILQEMKEFRPDCMMLVPLYVETFQRRVLMSIRESGKEAIFNKTVKISNRLRRVGIDLRRVLFGEILRAFGGKLRFMICGGAPLRPDLVELFDSIGITVINGYGITECSPLVAANRNDFCRIGSVGIPLPNMEVRLEGKNEAGEGEICVRGDNVMLGYYKMPEATAEVIDRGGFFHTGDIGRFDEEGVLYITGRCKNLIILSNGKNIYPEEIETALSAIPGALEVVVYEGQSRRGIEHNRVVAEIYPDLDYLKKAGIDNSDDYFHREVDAYNRGAVSYKKVGIVKVRSEEFPKNTLRKILRFRLDRTVD